jgi:DNA-directed RNA polymerase II subunit RPB2
MDEFDEKESDQLTEQHQFDVLSKFVDQRTLVHHQLDSFNWMVNFQLQKIIDETPSIHIQGKTSTHTWSFGHLYVENVVMTPQDARLRDQTYDTQVSVDIYVTVTEWDEDSKSMRECDAQLKKKVPLMRMPVMVKSGKCSLATKTNAECVALGECANDPGGYFIINGKERVLVCQERANHNFVFVFDNDEKCPYKSEIRSMSEETGHSVLLTATMNKHGKNITFSLPYMSKEVEAGAVFKALGFNSDNITYLIDPQTPEEQALVECVLRESVYLNTREKALRHISQASIHKVEDDDLRRYQYTEQVIDNELFPHMGRSGRLEKAIMLGDMLRKLFRVFLKTRIVDDRDNISCKRAEAAGVLISDLFRMNLKRYCDTLKKTLEKRPDNPDILMAMSRTNTITSSLKHVFSTGNWAAQKNSYVRTGVSQIMNRLTYPATISHLRRLTIPIGKEGKNVKIRQIHPTQTFFVDIIESPEGKSIGIVKNLALTTTISTGANAILVRERVMKSERIIPLDMYLTSRKWTRVYVNGVLIGLTFEPNELIAEFYTIRNEYKVWSEQVSFYYEPIDGDIRVLCDPGRFMRPVLVVENHRLRLTPDKLSWTWYQWVENDLIRYIDSIEVEHATIAMNPSDLLSYPDVDYDYCELHPAAMLGVCTAVIPFPEHNQSPRLVYQSSMVKQALGIYALSHAQRFDTVAHVMHYPQQPLVQTKFDKMFKYDEMLTGCNPVVAIATYGGYNQEDSVMMNLSSVQRGMFTHTCTKVVSVDEYRKSTNSFDKIEVPPEDVQNKGYNYSKLGPDGIIQRGTPVYKGDVIIGKTSTKVQRDEDEVKTDCSLVVGVGEEGIIDEVWQGENEESGYRIIKIKIRQLRIPEVGDKVASRSSQKGVTGILLNQEDMPFTSQGITPDIIINPHSQPSRMTISQLIECLLGKTMALSGQIGDATPFSSSSVDPVHAISERLHALGFQRHGNERMYCGYTGEMMDADIFIGPTYYQRLKHLVKDKMHSRSTGNVTMMHHQPSEGRSRDGGLRTGEMERDSLIAHGGSIFIKETFFDMSDEYTVNVCKDCGVILSKKTGCRMCGKENVNVKLNIPYCTKLLFQELMAMGISVHISASSE